jgi:hypothetical protein
MASNKRDGNIALKCTFNDDRRRPLQLGFLGTCSNENIERNVQGPTRRIWCSQSDCAAFYAQGFRGPVPSLPCYESNLFQNWRFGTGVLAHQTPKERMDVPRHALPGKVAVLTTRFPGEDEGARRIIGAMLIKDIAEDKQWGSMMVVGDPQCSFRAPEDPPFLYWDFKTGSRRWHEHLYRYISDEEVANYLRAFRSKVMDLRVRAIVDRQLAVLR